jgi:Flp pilus assembly secretin CpaC
MPQPSRHQSEAAEEAYLSGARLLDRNDLAAAEAQFNLAVRLNPRNHDYAMASAMAHEYHVTALVQQAGKARILGQNARAESLLAEARTLDPRNSIVTQHADPGPLPINFQPQMESADPITSSLESLAGPVVIKPNNTIQSFHIHADVQSVIRQVAASYGILPTFDESVIHQDLRFDLDSVDYGQAFRILLQMAHLFAVPLGPDSILLAKDTPENRQRFERMLEETIFVPGMTNEQMGELGNVVRNVFDLKQVMVQNGLGTLVIRAPESILNAINLTLADIVDGRSEVMFDLKLYEVDKSSTRNTGPQLPTQLGIYNVNGAASALVNANQSIVNQAIAQGLIPSGSSNVVIALALIASGLVQSTLLSSTVGFIGGGLTQTGITYSGTPTFNLALNSSETHAIDDVQLRIGDRQAASFRAGTRYPITTSTYTAPAVGTTSALSGISINGVSASSLLSTASSTTIPQIQYEDLGITLKATPTVQKSGVISMHLDMKIEALGGSSVDNIPILENRQFVSDTTVADGETALLVSSLTKSEANSISGLPGLSELPGFQAATSDLSRETDSTELVLLITPHIVRRRSNVVAGPRIAVDLPASPD